MTFWRPSQFLQISTLVIMVKRPLIQQTSTSSGNLGEFRHFLTLFHYLQVQITLLLNTATVSVLINVLCIKQIHSPLLLNCIITIVNFWDVNYGYIESKSLVLSFCFFLLLRISNIYTHVHNCMTSPNLVTFSLKDFTSYITEVGWPYLWAQWLGGLQFLENNAVNTPEEDVSFAHMQQTIRRLKQRVRSRLCLMKQTAAFGRYKCYWLSKFRIYIKKISKLSEEIL